MGRDVPAFAGRGLNRHDAKTPRNSWCEEGRTRVEGDLKFEEILARYRSILASWRLGGSNLCFISAGVPLTDGFMDGMMGIR